METHIGNIIEKLLLEKRMSVRELANKISYTPQAVYRILKRKMPDPFLLGEISKALEHNLFQYVYQAPKELIQQNESEELRELRRENADLKEKLVYLKTIQELVAKKK